MAKTSSIAKANKKPKFPVRQHNRCHICGRPRAFLRKFGICRLCFRGLALKGEIPGVMKAVAVIVGEWLVVRRGWFFPKR